MIKYPGDDDITFPWIPKLDNFNNEEKLRNTFFHIYFNVTAKYRFTPLTFENIGGRIYPKINSVNPKHRGT